MGIVGVADLMEEIARIYGYDRIPETRLSDELPPQRENQSLGFVERIKDILVNLEASGSDHLPLDHT